MKLISYRIKWKIRTDLKHVILAVGRMVEWDVSSPPSWIAQISSINKKIFFFFFFPIYTFLQSTVWKFLQLSCSYKNVLRHKKAQRWNDPAWCRVLLMVKPFELTKTRPPSHVPFYGDFLANPPFSFWKTEAIEAEIYVGGRGGGGGMLSLPENWRKQTVRKTCRDCLVNLKMGLDGIQPKWQKKGGLKVNFWTLTFG